MNTFETISHQIKVRVLPQYVERESSLRDSRHVFTYFITIENHGNEPVTLKRRYWTIYDEIGERFHVEGDGVVGKTPTLSPGEAFDYNSFCVLESGKGWMRGYYEMETAIGKIKVNIPKFDLVANFIN